MKAEFKIGEKAIYENQEVTIVQIWERDEAPNQIMIEDKDGWTFPDLISEDQLDKVERKD